MKKLSLTKWILILLFSFIICNCDSCKSTSSPEPPKPAQYWSQIEVTYDRGFNANRTHLVYLAYELFDPNAAKKSEHDHEWSGQTRRGVFVMEQVPGTSIFKGYLEQVFVQTEGWHKKHAVYLMDLALGTGYFCERITIEKAYDQEVVSYRLYFKISKQ